MWYTVMIDAKRSKSTLRNRIQEVILANGCPRWAGLCGFHARYTPIPSALRPFCLCVEQRRFWKVRSDLNQYYNTTGWQINTSQIYLQCLSLADAKAVFQKTVCFIMANRRAAQLNKYHSKCVAKLHLTNLTLSLSF